jgi:hypothetical protein
MSLSEYPAASLHLFTRDPIGRGSEADGLYVDLIFAHADVNIEDKEGAPLLVHAERCGHRIITNMLREAKGIRR